MRQPARPSCRTLPHRTFASAATRLANGKSSRACARVSGGAMGAAALVGLGLAQAQPKKTVLVVTGDGEQLMAFGSLATIAVAKARNLSAAAKIRV